MRAPQATLSHDPGRAAVSARGLGGRVVFNGRAVVIDRTHTASFLVHGFSGPRVIPLHDLRAVRMRRPWAWFRGSLQLVRVGAESAKRGGAGDADSVAFDARQRPEFEELLRALRLALAEQNIPVLVTAVDDPRQATRLGAASERSVVTEGEFLRLSARRQLQKIAADARQEVLSGQAQRAPPAGEVTRAARTAFAERWLPGPQTQARA